MLGARVEFDGAIGRRLAPVRNDGATRPRTSPVLVGLATHCLATLLSEAGAANGMSIRPRRWTT